jgi:SAM-dependent methyltransferase
MLDGPARSTGGEATAASGLVEPGPVGSLETRDDELEGAVEADGPGVEDQVRSHWSTIANRMRERRSGGRIAGHDTPYYRYKSDQFQSRLLSQVPVVGKSVLDVGCGAGGPLSAMAQRRPRRLVGCDLTPEMVELARENVPSAEIVQIDGGSLPFGDGEFDLLTTVTVLQHNPDDLCARLLAEICRVSNDQVFLFEDTRQGDDYESESQRQHENLWHRLPFWYANLCSKHGFDLTDTQYLRTKVSLRVSLTLSSLSRIHMPIERGTLPFTRLLDRWITDRDRELTMMRFVRRS